MHVFIHIYACFVFIVGLHTCSLSCIVILGLHVAKNISDSHGRNRKQYSKLEKSLMVIYYYVFNTCIYHINTVLVL